MVKLSFKLCGNTAGTSTEAALDRVQPIWTTALQPQECGLHYGKQVFTLMMLPSTSHCSMHKRAWNEVSDQKRGFELKFDLSIREAIYKGWMFQKEVKKRCFLSSRTQDTLEHIQGISGNQIVNISVLGNVWIKCRLQASSYKRAEDSMVIANAILSYQFSKGSLSSCFASVEILGWPVPK